MATGGVGSGTYGSTSNGTKIDTITVDAYGRVTGVATGATGDGDITGVTAGTGLTGGGTSGTPTLNVDVGTSANKIVQLDGSSRLPAVDGSQLTNIPGISGWSSSSGNLLPASATAGIYLGVSSATASNLLSDYEEGTWSPKHATSGGTPNQTYNYNNGYYVKIGNVVTITADVHISNGGGGFFDQRVSNFPFTTKNSTNTIAVGVFGFVQNTGQSSTKPMVWNAEENRTFGDVKKNDLSNCPAGTFTSNTTFKYTATYLTE